LTQNGRTRARVGIAKSWSEKRAPLNEKLRFARYTLTPKQEGPLAFASVKRFLLSSDIEDLEQQMKRKSASVVQMSRSRDDLAGVKAFRDKIERSFVGN
jgi:hypothetical protein